MDEFGWANMSFRKEGTFPHEATCRVIRMQIQKSSRTLGVNPLNMQRCSKAVKQTGATCYMLNATCYSSPVDPVLGPLQRWLGPAEHLALISVAGTGLTAGAEGGRALME